MFGVLGNLESYCVELRRSDRDRFAVCLPGCRIASGLGKSGAVLLHIAAGRIQSASNTSEQYGPIHLVVDVIEPPVSFNYRARGSSQDNARMAALERSTCRQDGW